METLGSTEWPDVIALTEYWAECPPLHTLVKAIAGALGVEFRSPEPDMPPVDFNKVRSGLSAAQGMPNTEHLGLGSRDRNGLPDYLKELYEKDAKGEIDLPEMTPEIADKAKTFMGIL